MDIEKKLSVCLLALEKKQQEFREKMAFKAQKVREAQRYNPHVRLSGNPHSRHASVNSTLIMDK